MCFLLLLLYASSQTETHLCPPPFSLSLFLVWEAKSRVRSRKSAARLLTGRRSRRRGRKKETSGGRVRGLCCFAACDLRVPHSLHRKFRRREWKKCWFRWVKNTHTHGEKCRYKRFMRIMGRKRRHQRKESLFAFETSVFTSPPLVSLLFSVPSSSFFFLRRKCSSSSQSYRLTCNFPTGSDAVCQSMQWLSFSLRLGL